MSKKKGNTRLELNHDGFRSILLSDDVKSLVQETADTICERANSMSLNPDDFEASTIQGYYGGGRYIGFVKSVTPDGALSEAGDKVLSRSVTPT